MVKESKFFRKQADKAERMARAISDVEISQSILNMAKAYRSQADTLKTKKLGDQEKVRQKAALTHSGLV
jgi:2-keto-4-pentenoate hydratase